MEKKSLKVVKIGGKLVEDKKKLHRFLSDFTALEGPKILVHGGGSMATGLAERLGYATKMVDGRRVTDENNLQVIIMTYAGLINKSIVAQLQGMNCNAIGLCGADGRSVISTKRKNYPVDFGFVGDIQKVNSEFIFDLLEKNMIPVFSPISCTNEGDLLNTNGDSIAGEIAKAMAKELTTELFYLLEKKGVLADVEEEDSVIESINRVTYEELLKGKKINEGMLPKLQNCFEALEGGVAKISLGNEELLRTETLHTEIVK